MIRALGLLVSVLAAALVLQPTPGVSLTPSPDRAPRDVRADYNASCYQQKAERARASYCKYGKRSARIKIAVVGDSKTKQYVTALDYAGRTRGWQIDVYSRTACSMGKYPATRDKKCATWNTRVLNRVRAKDYDYVITALYQTKVPKSAKYTSSRARHDRFISGLRSQIRRYQAKGGPKVIVFNSGPVMSRDIPGCVRRNRSKPSACDTKQSTALKPKIVWDASARRKLMRGVVPHSRLISLTGNICPSTTCRAVIGGKIVFRDSHHLTDTYVKNRRGFISRKLDRMI